MSEVKWVKISTDIFNSKSIKLISSMPEADAIFRIWIHLLVLAADTNNNGLIYLNENIPYTDEMLSVLLDKNINTVRLALDVLKRFDMITIHENNYIMLNEWSKHQNIEGLDKIREQTRARQQRFKEKQKNLIECLPINNKNNIELERDIEANNVISNVTSEIIDYLNLKVSSLYQNKGKNISYIKARLNEGYTLEDFKKVIDNKCDDWLNDKNMCKYLRPETLFGTKFDGYLNQKVIQKPTKTNFQDEIEVII